MIKASCYLLVSVFAGLIFVRCFAQPGMPYSADSSLSGYVVFKQPEPGNSKKPEVTTGPTPSIPVKKALGVIIFVHGVTGGALSTWYNKNSENNFAGMVSEDKDFQGYNVYTYGYASRYVNKSPKIDQIASDMAQELRKGGILDHSEIILVGHSMGGLVARSFLMLATDIPNEKIRFIALYSTPSGGSFLSHIARRASFNPQFKDMAKMMPENYIGTLLNQWLQHGRGAIPTYCLCEDADTFGLRVVPFDSAAHLCTKPIERLNLDHIQIAKPENQEGPAYTFFKRAFLETARKPTAEEKRQPRSCRIDLRQDIYFEVNLYGNDQVKPKTWPDDVKYLRYLVGDERRCVKLEWENGEGKEFKIDAPPGTRVLPEFVAECDGPARSVSSDTSNNSVELSVTPGSSYEKPRDLATEINLPAAERGTLAVASASGIGHGEPLDLCDELRFLARHVECRRTQRGFQLEPNATFGAGKWQDSKLQTILERLASVAVESKITGGVAIRGFASKTPYSCAALKKTMTVGIPISPWFVPGGGGSTFDLTSQRDGAAETSSCHDAARDQQRDGNYLLSFARAAWAAAVLEKQGLSVQLINAVSTRYALLEDNPLDRRIVINLAPQP